MCTTMIITKGATIDGSMMVTHSDDDELGDQRIVYVPASNNAPGTLRPIYKEHYRYPRIVTKNRGAGYDFPDYPQTEPIGYIPQVEHTYAYFDGNYGIVNEHNLMMGECTNGANYTPDAVTDEIAKKEGKHIRWIYSQELSRIALERCKKAREAIILMGNLIEKYGLYSTGETLLVADEDEAWVFEMCALPDEEYHSAWVAQRVPDGEVFVAANEFRIREVQRHSHDFMYSKLLFKGVEKLKWWDPQDGPLDWLKTVSQGEYNHPYYSLRRVWRVLDRVNPDLFLTPWVKDGYTKDYPFSVKPKRKLSLENVFSLYRDHYEGTQFDLSKGIAAGPYNEPNRFIGSYDGNQNNVTNDKTFYGAWERAISIFYQGYTYINQLRPKAPEATKCLCWFGPDVAYTTCFVPFSTKVDELPLTYQSGSPQKYSRQSAWWAFDFVANWARLNYNHMTEVDIKPMQEELEQNQLELIKEWDDTCKKAKLNEAIEYISKECTQNSNNILKQWWDMADMLIAKYSDGYMNLLNDSAARDIGYSSTWLSYTNYKDGPITYNMKP